MNSAIHQQHDIARLSQCYTGILHDVMRAQGLANFVLPASLRPLIPQQTICGPAFTVSGTVSPNSDAHETLLHWTGMLSQAKPGHIVVIQANDDQVAHMGELSAETLKLRGIRGLITDGGVRDAELIMKLGFQVWHRYFSPRDVVSHWLPETFEQAIRIGEVTIHPGDYLLGDLDGIVCIPQAHIDTVLTLAEKAMSQENQVRSAILQGMDPQQAYLQYGKF